MRVYRFLIALCLLAFANELLAQDSPEKHFLCMQLSLAPMSAGNPPEPTRSFLTAELSLMKRVQHKKIFSQFGLLQMNGIFNGMGRPDSFYMYRAIGPVLGAGYHSEGGALGFDFSGAMGAPLQRSVVKDLSFNYSVKVFFNVSYHGQFFIRFSNTTTISRDPQSIRQGGFGLQLLID
jgi:hypothetical protein